MITLCRAEEKMLGADRCCCSTTDPHLLHSPFPTKPRNSLQQQDELIHELVEIRLVLAFTFDLLNGMDHRGVMLAPETAADLG